MNRLLLVAGLCSALGACGAMPAVVGGVAAGVSAPTIAAALGISGTTLSEVVAAACAAQAAANFGAGIAASRGSSVWQQHLSEVSKLAGIGCAW